MLPWCEGHMLLQNLSTDVCEPQTATESWIFFFWRGFATMDRKSSCFDLCGWRYTNVMASNCSKRDKFNLWLPSRAKKRLCLSSLLTLNINTRTIQILQDILPLWHVTLVKLDGTCHRLTNMSTVSIELDLPLCMVLSTFTNMIHQICHGHNVSFGNTELDCAAVTCSLYLIPVTTPLLLAHSRIDVYVIDFMQPPGVCNALKRLTFVLRCTYYQLY